MLQELIATTTLGSLIGIGEFFDEAHEAKAGKYNVYKVFRQEDEYAILFVHEAENQDVNTLLPQLDAQESFGVDGGSYGILTMKDESDTWSGNDRFEEWYEYSEDDSSEEKTDGYVTWTNYGDGDFILFSNNENSVFLLDDEDVYLSELLADCEKFDMGNLEYYSFGSNIEVDYAVSQADGVELVEKKVKLPEGKRKIDAIADLIRTILNEG